MTSLYEYIKNDKPELLNNMTRAVCKKLWIEPGWEGDVRHEVLLSWLDADFDPSRAHGEILGYAFNRAFMQICEWRRRTVVPVTITRAVRPEPFSIPLEALHGDTLDRFIVETEADDLDPMNILIAHEDLEALQREDLDDYKRLMSEEGYDPMTAYAGLREDLLDAEPTLDDVTLPADPAGQKSYRHILDMLAEDELVRVVAKNVGVTPRTVYRRLNEIRSVNRHHV